MFVKKGHCSPIPREESHHGTILKKRFLIVRPKVKLLVLDNSIYSIAIRP